MRSQSRVQRYYLHASGKKVSTRLKISGNLKGMWKKILLKPTIEKTLWVLLMEPQINIFVTDPKLSHKGTLQRCGGIRAKASLRSTLVFLWCLLCFCSLSSDWQDASISRCIWRVVCPPSNHPGGADYSKINCTLRVVQWLRMTLQSSGKRMQQGECLCAQFYNCFEQCISDFVTF